jgi:hypothetical protein
MHPCPRGHELLPWVLCLLYRTMATLVIVGIFCTKLFDFFSNRRLKSC